MNRIGRNMKRTLAWVLSVLMLCGVIPVENMTVKAYYDPAKEIPASAVTANQQESICNVAWSQYGYVGGTQHGSGDKVTYENAYGAYFGNNPSQWCALFVVWCARNANIGANIVPYSSTVTDFAKEYSKKGRLYITTDGAYCSWEKSLADAAGGVWKEASLKDIKKGDILMIESVGTPTDGADHIALAVSDWNGSSVTTVEGNWGNKVQSKERNASDIHAFCRPDYSVPAVSADKLVGISDVKLESKYWDSFSLSFKIDNASELKSVSANAWPSGDKNQSKSVNCVKEDERYKVTVRPADFNHNLFDYTVGITAVGNYNTATNDSFTFNFKDLFTEDKAWNVVNVTNAQIGYHIDNKSDCKYSLYYNKTPGAGWATYFVKWVMDMTSVEYAPIDVAPSTTKTLVWARDNGYYHRINGTSWSYGNVSDGGAVENYRPVPGDVVILEGNATISDGPDTIGIVVGYDFGTVAIVTADSNNVYDLDLMGYADTEHIWGYIHPYEKNAVVEPAKYTISYDANGGTISVSPATKTENVDITLTSVQPVRAGYKFLGWSTDKNGTTAVYQPGDLYTDNGDITLYAVWKEHTVVEKTGMDCIELKADVLSYQSTKLNWTDTGWDSYKIKRSLSENGTYETIGTVTDGSTYTDNALKEETQYYYIVYGCNEDGAERDRSNLATCITQRKYYGFTTGRIQEALEAEKRKFPQNAYWNHVGKANDPDSCTNTACSYHYGTTASTCNDFDGGYQCWGFARKLCFDIFGTYVRRLSTGELQGWYVSSFDQLAIGDMLDKDSHTVVVYKINGDRVTLAECNTDYCCRIRWDREFSKSELKSQGYTVYHNPYNISTSGTPTVAVPSVKELKDGTVEVSWTDTRWPNIAVKGFTEKNITGSTRLYKLISSGSAGSYIDAGVVPDTTYYYAMQGVQNGYGEENSNLVAVRTMPTKFAIHYDTNGGDTNMGVQYRFKGIGYTTISSDVPERNGYTFVGWGLSSDAEEVVYSPGDVFEEDDDITIYAIWEQQTGAQLQSYSMSLLDGSQAGTDFTLNMFFKCSEDIALSEDTFVELTYPTAKKNVKLQRASTERNGNSYLCRFECPIAPKQFSEVLSVKLICGEYTGEPATCSAQQYLMDLLHTNTDEKQQQLITAILDYGTYAQLFFEYNMDILANDECYTDDISAVELKSEEFDRLMNDESNALQGISENEDFAFVGASIVCDNQLALKLYFEAFTEDKFDGSNTRISIRKVKDNTLLSDSQYSVDYIGDRLVLNISGLNGVDLADRYSVSVTKNSKQLFFSYSPITYIQLTQGTDSNLKNLGKAIYLYNRAVMNYLK